MDGLIIIAALDKNPSMAVEVLCGIIKGRKAVSRKAYCLRHRRHCYLRCASSHTAGSSCTAHSAQGLSLSLSDPNVLHLLAWCALRMEIQKSSLTLENVPGFPSEILSRILGDAYVIECHTLDPRMLGCL